MSGTPAWRKRPKTPEQTRSAFAGTVEDAALERERVHRFVHGIDERPRPMTDDELAALNDPFATLVLRRGHFPATGRAVLEAIDAATQPDDPLRQQMTFVVGEGSQIPWTKETASLARGLRLTITRGRDSKIDVLVSTDFRDGFVQVMAWDERTGGFQFYERIRGEWIWGGNSVHALDPRSRGRGPFDSHVSGGLVMKELKVPWVHWHSIDATVPPEVFAPDDPARTDPLFTKKVGAEVLEIRVVRPGVRRWIDARFAKLVAPDGVVSGVGPLVEHLFGTPTVNLVSSTRQSNTVEPGERLRLPPSFFSDVDGLCETLKLPAAPALEVSGDVYLESLERFEFALVDGDFRQPGDAHFAFVVPERAFEDVDVVNKCLEVGLLSERFVACALMVDFPNPIFSARRAALLRHVPDRARLANGSSDLSEVVAAAIEGTARDAPRDAPEHEFLSLWSLGDGWRPEAERRLQAYSAAIGRRLATPGGFDDYVRLAESRRRRVWALELSERRPLLFPRTNIPDGPALEMTSDGTVRPAAP